MSMDQSDSNLLVQNVRDFTVQIRRAGTETIVGTGFVVSNEGHIVTCAHVVQDAGVALRAGRHVQRFWAKLVKSLFKLFQVADGATDAKGAEVGVYFPQVHQGEKQDRRAVVIGYFPDHDDDVVLLQLVDGPSPLSPDKIAVLGRAEQSELHPFRSYGYRRLNNYDAGLADGIIQGPIGRTRDHKVQADPVQLQSSQINRGMSGAAVLDLDEQRNLVVGVISEIWDPGFSTKDRDTAWAVNARVLSLEPLNLPLQDKPYPLRSARQPQTDIAAVHARTSPRRSISLNGAPPPLEERWVGRVTLLQELNTEWADAGCYVSELIGFGGEGKSSLARHWLYRLLQDRQEPQPDGVFWWNCYDDRSVDALFEKALQFLSGELIDSRRLSSSVRAEVIGAMLGAGRYLFILDGLEVLQHQEGDAYGLLLNPDLRKLLGYFATPGHKSFCLVTSRAPLFDLISYPTFHHHEVERLSQEDGRELLRKLGVTGPDAALDRLVADWDGYALILSLLGGLLVEHYGGDVAHIADLPAPIANEPRYEGVQRVLRRYDEHLKEEERAFLMIFSAFHRPVPERALAPVFRAKPEDIAHTLTASLATLIDHDFEILLKRLLTYKLLTYNEQKLHYTTHPLIRAYYLERLKLNAEECKRTFDRIRDYFLSLPPENLDEVRTLSDLDRSLQIYYAQVDAERWEEAAGFYGEQLRDVLRDNLAAYYTIVELLGLLFPGKAGQAMQWLAATPEQLLQHIAALSLSKQQGDRVLDLAKAYFFLGRNKQALTLYEFKIKQIKDSSVLYECLYDYARSLRDDYQMAASLHVRKIARDLAEALNDIDKLAISYVNLLGYYREIGDWTAAEDAYRQIINKPPSDRIKIGLANAERYRAQIATCRGQDATEILKDAWELAVESRYQLAQQQIHRWQGEAALQKGQLDEAIKSFEDAITLAQTSGDPILPVLQGRLAYAYTRQEHYDDARQLLAQALERTVTLEITLDIFDLYNSAASIYLVLGEYEQAEKYALEAYKKAWADGPPYSFWWDLERAKSTLKDLGVPEPPMPRFDPARVRPMPYEKEIQKFIEELKASQNPSEG